MKELSQTSKQVSFSEGVCYLYKRLEESKARKVKTLLPILSKRELQIFFIYPLIRPLPEEFSTLVQESSDVSGIPGDSWALH